MHGAPLADDSRLEVVFKIIDERDALVMLEYLNKIQSAPPSSGQRSFSAQSLRVVVFTSTTWTPNRRQWSLADG